MIRVQKPTNPRRYLVGMGQGITVPDLGVNTLCTGAGNDMIYSCSAVIFYNMGDRRAGLYHYPARDIVNRRQNTETILSRMIAATQPDRAWILYGVLKNILEKPGSAPGDDSYHKLNEYIKERLLAVKEEYSLRSIAAQGGGASISQTNNEPTIETVAPPVFWDLRPYAAGQQTFGCIYK